MLQRTQREAIKRGLLQVDTVQADIGQLPFADGEFDLCVTFTGLHCVPDPQRAVVELGRVTRSGGELSGSFWASDVRTHQLPLQIFARTAGLVGGSATAAELRQWLAQSGFSEPQIRRSGDMIYFRAQRR
jgi:ubiquinone/menaquinone biosynthesis C-methylase UbiE